ncbi:glucosamine-6-phosphate deaminase [Atopobacter phocae]|uniref:glucosamine-6-phosphate deaminase n=1 Tax=Atopobacter phocae TaxID=136492 RepID=UPI00046FFD6D|nr:glucosamine-6-phosphate deaminase [Atopobacter phocae]
MQLIVKPTAAEASQAAFELIREAKENGATVFGLATGSTPEPLYQLFIDSDLDFTDSYSVNLDEYVGLGKDDPQSYQYYMQHKLFDHKPFKESFVPNGLNDEASEIEHYESILEAHPVDVQILGIGENGHIAFNEPGTPFNSRTHKVQLTESTINANKRFFEKEEDVPRYAYSMGLSSIMSAKQIVLLAFGEKKAQAIHDLFKAHPSADIPSTILQSHADVTVIVDEAAASLV